MMSPVCDGSVELGTTRCQADMDSFLANADLGP